MTYYVVLYPTKFFPMYALDPIIFNLRTNFLSKLAYMYNLLESLLGTEGRLNKDIPIPRDIFIRQSVSFFWFLLHRRKDNNTILVCRLAMWLICTFLRMVWGGGKGEEYSLSVRTSSQPSVQYDSVLNTLRISLALNSSCVLCVIKVLFCAWSAYGTV